MTDLNLDLGLLLLRLLLATLLTGHAFQKSLGWFRGMGLASTAATFESWGFRPGKAHVLLAAAGELLGAALLAIGLLTPLGSMVVVGTMVVASAPNATNGLWAHLGGCEVAVTYAGIAAALAFTGPGTISLDYVLGTPDLTALITAVGLAVAATAAIPPLTRRRHVLQSNRR